MNRRGLLLSAVALSAMPAIALAGDPVAPVVPRIPKRTVQLGRVRVDDYAWLRDPNYQAVLKDPARLRADIRADLDAENA
jgi:oligopeptidase B